MTPGDRCEKVEAGLYMIPKVGVEEQRVSLSVHKNTTRVHVCVVYARRKVSMRILRIYC